MTEAMKNPAESSVARYVLAGLFVLVALVSLRASLSDPIYNWDVVMYVAAARSIEGGEAGEIHAYAYERIAEAMPPARYAELCRGNPYKHAIWSDPGALREQLPFYQIRPLYVWLVYLLSLAGVPIVFATHLVSGVSILAALAVLHRMSVTHLEPRLAFAVPVLAMVFGVTELARLSTPDAMAFLAVVVCSWLVLEKKPLTVLVIAPLCLGVRTDLILFVLPLVGAVFLAFERARLAALASGFACLGLHFGINHLYDNQGWAAIFYFTFVERLTHPVSAPGVLTARHYALALYRGTNALVVDHGFLLYALATGYWLHGAWRTPRQRSLLAVLWRPRNILAWVSLVFVVSHFVLFPVPWLRFFSAAYLVGAFALLAGLSRMSGDGPKTDAA